VFIPRHILLKEPLRSPEGFTSAGVLSIRYGLVGKSRYGPWPGLTLEGAVKFMLGALGNRQPISLVRVKNFCSSER